MPYRVPDEPLQRVVAVWPANFSELAATRRLTTFLAQAIDGLTAAIATLASRPGRLNHRVLAVQPSCKPADTSNVHDSRHTHAQ
jgi:hypothetical protein